MKYFPYEMGRNFMGQAGFTGSPGLFSARMPEACGQGTNQYINKLNYRRTDFVTFYPRYRPR